MSDVLTLDQIKVPGTARSKDDAIRESGEMLVGAGHTVADADNGRRFIAGQREPPMSRSSKRG